MDSSIIESSVFLKLSPSGAIQLSIGKCNISIIDSVFSQCYNSETSGGAISIADWEYGCRILRCCGDECNTLNYGSGNDFGQFIFIKSSSASCTALIEYSIAVKCPEKQVTLKHNGPFGFRGSSEFSVSNSNSSNNQCRLGPGIIGHKTSKMTINFMYFAYDLTDNKDATTDGGYLQFWIAAVFFEGTGIVKNSNFVECESKYKGTKKPPGTYTQCFFQNCKNYAADTLVAGSTTNEMNVFPLPLLCARRSLSKHSSKFKLNSNIIEIFSFTLFLALALNCV